MTARPTLSLSSVEEAIDPNPLVVSPAEALIDVIRLMNARRSDYALVVSEQDLAGIFTTRDITRLIAAEIDIGTQPISQLMTRQVVSLRLNDVDSIWSAISILSRYHVRHLPVLDEQSRIVGIMTPYSVREALEPIDLLKLRRVAEAMATEVICATPDASMLYVSRLMMAHQVSCVVIAETDAAEHITPVGILTERDIVKLQSHHINVHTTPAVECMSQPLYTVTADGSLWNAHQSMKEHGIRRMVVVDRAGHLAGLLTQTNLLKAIDPLELPEVIAALEEIVTRHTLSLQQTNQQLQLEVMQREQTQATLQTVNEALQGMVAKQGVALNQTEAHYQLLVNNVPDGIARFDRENRFIYVNATIKRSFNLPAEAFLGKTHAEIEQFSASTVASFQQAIQQVFATATEVEREMECHTMYGRQYQSVQLVPELGANGEVETVLAIARDITPLKQIEVDTRRLSARERELSTLTNIFINTVSHEFRTPLTIITTSTELLQNFRDRYNDAQIRERLDRIQTATQYITHLMNDLLIISNLMSGQYQLDLVETDVLALAAELVEKYRRELPPQLTINLTHPSVSLDTPVRYRLDINLLRLILDNLLSNSVKFSPQGGSITLDLTVTEVELVFYVADTGIGIPSDDLPHLFQPFFRASNAQTIRGNGVGLAIVDYCVDYLQAAISIESQVGAGTWVTVRLAIQDQR